MFDIPRNIQTTSIYGPTQIQPEKLIETAFNSMNDAISIIDMRDFKIIDVTKGFLDKYGLKKEEVIGRTCYEITHKRAVPCTPPDDICPLLDTIKTGEHSEVEHVHYIKDGRKQNLEISTSPIRDENGEIIQVVHVARDITERKCVEEALSKARVQHLLSASPAVIYSFRPSGDYGVTFISENVTSQLGYEPREFTEDAKFWANHIHPDDASRILAEQPRLFEHEHHSYEYRFLHKDGTYRWMRDEMRLVRDGNGNPVEIVGSWIDITERKCAEDGLRESEVRYRTLAEAAHDIIFIINRNDEVQYVNTFAAKQLGCRPEDLLGKPRGKLFPPEISERQRCSLQSVFKAGAPAHFEDNTLFPDHLMWLDTWLVPLSNEAGEVIAVMGISRDITERRKAEELRLENERLTYANQAKSEFLSSVSHDIRTPLNAIIGFSELLKQGIVGELKEKQEHYVDNVITSSKFLLSLINNILDLSKIEAGKMELVIERISVHETINETLTFIKGKVAKHNIILKKEFDPKLELIEADEQRLKQILFNLLDNAVKFSKKEGGTVTLTTEKVKDMVQISVSDTGVGIKDRDMGKLFTKFQQLDPGRKVGSTGLGLAITKQLVEMHGGKIWAESNFGEGSTFTFLLPLTAEKQEEK